MLDALTLDQLRTFVAVAEAGSFRAAAGAPVARAVGGEPRDRATSRPSSASGCSTVRATGRR